MIDSIAVFVVAIQVSTRHVNYSSILVESEKMQANVSQNVGVTHFHPIPPLHLDNVFQRQFRALLLSTSHFFLILKFIIIARFC